jgi:hypothetical protein
LPAGDLPPRSETLRRLIFREPSSALVTTKTDGCGHLFARADGTLETAIAASDAPL